jgi:hypothetical protein
MKKVLVPAFLSLGVLLLGIVYLSTPEIEEVNFNSPEL